MGLGKLWEIRILFAAVVLLAFFSIDDVSIARENEPPDIFIRTEWFEVPPVEGNPTRSAIMFWRQIDPVTDAPVRQIDITKFKVGDLRRTFSLEKSEFLLGEPILIQFRIELNGPGKFREFLDGDYGCDRDNSFLFLMKRVDGAWVRNPYGGMFPRGWARGCLVEGAVGQLETVKGNPASYWLAVQRWCAIEEPGTYDLFCLRAASHTTVDGRWDLWRGKKIHWVRKPSPILDEIPKTILKIVSAKRLMSVSDFAKFRIVVREPKDDDERDSMIRLWTAEARQPTYRMLGKSERHHAVADGIIFSVMDDFLGVMESWMTDHKIDNTNTYRGLALRTSHKALELIFKHRKSTALDTMISLSNENVRKTIPILIDFLVHDNDQVRTLSEEQLRDWTGQAFLHTWKGTVENRPTKDEGLRMQRLWRAWWKENRVGFIQVGRNNTK